MQLESGGRGSGVAGAPNATHKNSSRAAEVHAIAQGASEFQDAGLCWLASCLARRHRVALAVAKVAAEQRWRP